MFCSFIIAHLLGFLFSCINCGAPVNALNRNVIYSYRILKEVSETIYMIQNDSGLVSIFVKRALENIAKKDSGDFVDKNRNYLKKLINENKYAELSYQLKVRRIMLSDYDNQTFNVPYMDDKKYSPWNISGMFEEFLGNSTEILGNFDSLEGRDYCFYLNFPNIDRLFSSK